MVILAEASVNVFGGSPSTAAAVALAIAGAVIVTVRAVSPAIERWSKRDPVSGSQPVTSPIPRVDPPCPTAAEIRELVRVELAAQQDRIHDSVRKIVGEELRDLYSIATSTHSSTAKCENNLAQLQPMFATGIERQANAARRVEEIATKVDAHGVKLADISATVHALESGRTGSR